MEIFILVKMNKYQILVLKSIRKVYLTLFNSNKVSKLEYINNADQVSQIIYEALMADQPCMIARFGSTELACLVNYVGLNQDKNKYLKYIRGKTQSWWWESNIINQMQQWSGFFPAREDKIEQFCKLMFEDIPEVDVLGSWIQHESYFKNILNNATKVRLMYLDPYWTSTPWTAALKGKKILVVHPFTETIEKQYAKRELLFKTKDFLPEFQSLSLVKAVQSLGNEETPFEDWFEALDYMKSEINKADFDICLIGCGAYGFPLAAHVKRMGKKAFHIGGSLQLLFGIKGKRWEVNDPHPEPGNDIIIDYYSLPNEYWVRPLEEEKPANHSKVEDSCYW